jgi:transcriptional regulator with XRE-family HTH domain
MKSKIAERIRRVRVIKDLSQENIASELGISIGAYSNIERGKSEVTVSRLYALAKILKVSILEFLPIEGNEKTEQPIVKNYSVNHQQSELNDLKVEISLLKKEVGSLKKKQNQKTKQK